MSAAAAVEACNSAFYAAFETGDLDGMEQVWVEDTGSEGSAASAACVHPGWPTVVGRSRILRSWAVIMANTAYIQFFLTDVDVRLAGDVAVLTCTENILTGGADATTAMESTRVVATNVFRREAHGWRLWVHHGSPVLASDPGRLDE